MENKQSIEERIAALGSFTERFMARQKDREKRYALDWYGQHSDKSIRKMIVLDRETNKKTAQLAATSKAIGTKALAVAAAAAILSFTVLILQIRATYRA